MLNKKADKGRHSGTGILAAHLVSLGSSDTIAHGLWEGFKNVQQRMWGIESSFGGYRALLMEYERGVARLHAEDEGRNSNALDQDWLQGSAQVTAVLAGDE